MLFEPIQIGGITLPCRIAIPPMVITDSDESGTVTDREVAHYRRLGASGAAMVIQEATCVNDHSKLCATEIGIWDDRQIEGLRRISEAIHAGGAKAFMQLHHAGIKSVGDRREVPYDYDEVLWGTPIRGSAMTQETAERIRDEFIAAGRRAMLAGYDGVELHAAHGYLLSQILNASLNRRTDTLGTDPCGYVRSILDGIRQATDGKLLVGIRIGGEEPTIADGIDHVLRLRGSADYFHVSYGFSESPATRSAAVADFPYSATVWMAMRVKQALRQVGDDTPVLAVGDLSKPGIAERVLAETGVDMVCVGRGHLVNDQWSNDLRAGRAAGACLLCRQCRWREGICPGQRLLRKQRAGSGG